MFRSNQEHQIPWGERTLSALRAQRFDRAVRQLPPLTHHSLEQMDMRALTARIEGCWQDIPRKPLRAQQASVAQAAVLRTIERQADCLSQQEHALCERLLAQGGSVRIIDAQEMDAAQALSLRLLAHVGLVGEAPMLTLDACFAPALEQAFGREAHARTRMRLFAYQATVCAALYLAGVLDDREPQRLFTVQVLGEEDADEEALQLARRYLWASFDCVDYEDGVLLVHPAVTDPHALARTGARLGAFTARELLGGMQGILPQEEPLEDALRRALSGALRPGTDEAECVRSLRLLCKQGAPLKALEEVLDSMLMVCRTPRMHAALGAMHAGVVRWDAPDACVVGMLQ